MTTSNVNFLALTLNAQAEREAVTFTKEQLAEHAKANKVTIRAAAIQLDLANALAVRMNNQLINGKTQNINSSMFTDMSTICSVHFLQSIEILLKEKFDLSNIAAMLKVTDHKHDDFMQVYAITKVLNLLVCIARKDRKRMNAYTLAILVNLLKFGMITKKEAESAVCLDLHRSASRNKQREIINVYDSASSTASTQISSSRMSLKALNICNIRKKGVNDEMTFNEQGQYLNNVLFILQMNENTSAELERVAAEIEQEQQVTKKVKA